jgi:Flp pilus assembly pilin Flp
MTSIALSPRYGQSMLEYALIMLFVLLVVFGALLLLGPTLSSIFQNASSGL